ncbi:DUF397 domain-containing protein [Streptomyces sp. ITFR-16]|uniref:DUF397 domain-containing protein n=1 Tax=Streptomyces sp. ITFR-16 TaxID=3075198 RepID=UPI00288BB5AA|nr:DUF397 domain-containing protein [Streptomyces sp. ITFR-16]WNI22866.1 DUF397 domain-containing protein [Streptomyces sp. ITFR-16]
MSTTTELNWFKSSYSGGDGDNCIEVAADAETIHIRDSKDIALLPLAVSGSAWADFTAYASSSEVC